MNSLIQDEIKIVVGLLSQVQLVHKDSKIVNNIIDKLDAQIYKPQPEDVPVNKIESTPETTVEAPVVPIETPDVVEAPIEPVIN